MAGALGLVARSLEELVVHSLFFYFYRLLVRCIYSM